MRPITEDDLAEALDRLLWTDGEAFATAFGIVCERLDVAQECFARGFVRIEKRWNGDVVVMTLRGRRFWERFPQEAFHELVDGGGLAGGSDDQALVEPGVDP